MWLYTISYEIYLNSFKLRIYYFIVYLANEYSWAYLDVIKTTTFYICLITHIKYDCYLYLMVES